MPAHALDNRRHTLPRSLLCHSPSPRPPSHAPLIFPPHSTPYTDRSLPLPLPHSPPFTPVAYAHSPNTPPLPSTLRPHSHTHIDPGHGPQLSHPHPPLGLPHPICTPSPLNSHCPPHARTFPPHTLHILAHAQSPLPHPPSFSTLPGCAPPAPGPARPSFRGRVSGLH